MLRIVTTLLMMHLTTNALKVLSNDGAYRVNSASQIEKINGFADPPTSFNCSTCSPWQDKLLHIGHYYLQLSQTAVSVIRNGSITQVLYLECPPRSLARATGGNAYVICKPSELDSWKPKFQPVVFKDDGYVLEAPQNGGDAGITIWSPSQYNSAMVEDGRGRWYFISITGYTIWSYDTTSLMPSLIDSPPWCTTQGATLTSVGSLAPTDGNYRFTLGCSQGAVKRRYVMDQLERQELPVPLTNCDFPPIAARGGRYVLAFCAGPFAYILDFTAGTTKYVVCNGLTMGDQLVFVSDELVAIVTLNKDITLLNLALEYRVPGTGRRKIPNTASVALLSNSATDDGMLLACKTDGTSNWCAVFNVSSNVTAPVTTFYLASIRPDAAILEQGDLVATTQSLTTSSPNTVQTGSDATLVPVITVVAAVVIAAVVAPLVVVLVIAYNNSVRKKALLTIPHQETVHPDASSRTNGCDQETVHPDASSRTNGCDQETVHPDASSRTNGCGQESRDNSKNSSTADLANSGDGCSNGIP